MGIPVGNLFQGLPIYSQTWAYSPRSNAAGAISSNGFEMVIGQ
jgi:hypothetical protein